MDLSAIMKLAVRLFSTLLLLHSASLSALAADEPEPSAEEVVKLVHLSRALKKHDLNGELRKGNIKSAFNIQLQEKFIRFTFADPKQIIHLDLGDKSYRLFEVKAGSNAAVPDSQYAQGIRGTDLTYEDVSFRYLYWPNPMKLDNERVSTRKCFKIQLNNPGRVGAYNAVLIWVDQESGGLLKMEGYRFDKGADGKPKWTLLKRCKVTEGMKVEDTTVLKEMSIEAFDPQTGKGQGKTFLEMSKP